MSKPTHIQLVAEVGARPARATIPLHTLDVRTDGLKTTAHLPDGCSMILHTAATPADALVWHELLDDAITVAVGMCCGHLVRWSGIGLNLPTVVEETTTQDAVARAAEMMAGWGEEEASDTADVWWVAHRGLSTFDEEGIRVARFNSQAGLEAYLLAVPPTARLGAVEVIEDLRAYWHLIDEGRGGAIVEAFLRLIATPGSGVTILDERVLEGVEG